MTTDQPEAIQTGASKNFEAMGQVLGTAQDITQKWNTAVNSMQETTAKTQATDFILQLENEAETDPNINGLESRRAALDHAKQGWLKGIANGSFKTKLDLELSHMVNASSIKLKNTYAKKAVFADNQNTWSLLQNYAKIGTPEAHQEAFNLLQTKVAGGFYTPEQASSLLNKAQKVGVQTDIYSDPASMDSESMVLAELEKGPKGKYSYLDGEERIKFIKESRRVIKQNRLYQAEERVNSRLSILNDFADGKIDPATNPELLNSIAIQDPELGEAILKGNDTTFIPKLDNEAFAEVTKEVFQASSREEISKYLLNTLSRNANKDISRERLAILIKAATERAKGLKATADSQPVTLPPEQVEKDSLVKSLLYSTNPLLSAPNMLVNFFNAINKGSSPKEAHEAAVKTEVGRTNPLSLKYKVGDVVTNPQGISGEIIGFNDNGSPIIRRKR